MRGLRDELLEIVNSILKDAGWKQQEYSNVLWWALRYMQKYLNGDLDPTAVYSDLLFTGGIRTGRLSSIPPCIPSGFMSRGATPCGISQR